MAIPFAGLLLLLVLMVWVPISSVRASERTSEPSMAETATMQATPAEDATVTALNKEKLAQEVQQLKNQNEPDFFGRLQTNAVLLSTLVVVLGSLIGLFRWLADQRSEREKRVEERFQAAVTGLGDDKEGTRIGAAILLRTFLRPDYERFYTQIFQLVAANLRLPRNPNPPEYPAAPLPLTALSQALMMAFMEAFPLARDQKKQAVGTKLASNEYKVRSTHPAPVTISSAEIHSLNAVGVLLDNGFLWYADLKQAWLAQASLRKTDLTGADLSGANLYAANLSEAFLWETDLSGANLWQANLCKADLRGTNLSGATLLEANLSEATLYRGVKLTGANLFKANLSEAKLYDVDLLWAVLKEGNLSGAEFNGTDLEDARSLEKTDLRGVKGLTREQLLACKAKGAIIDEDATTNAPQPTAAPPPPPQQSS
jgi:uncharacterized protein YjbI with pentapeptide repeats